MKRIAWILMAVLLLLAACPALALGEPVEIVMWSLFSGEDGATMNQIVEDFNNSQSDVKLTHIIIDYNNLMTRIALSANDDSAAPHLFVSYASDITYLANLQYIKPLQPALDAYDTFDFSLDRYNEACKVLNVYQGERYAVTLDFPSLGLYANMDLVNEYCPEVLEDDVVTWEEIMAVGARLKEQGIEDIKVLTSEWAMNDLVQAYLLYADTWATDDGMTLALDRSALIAGTNLWKTCYDAGYLWEEGDDCAGLFAQGESIFFTGGNWCMNAVREYGFDFVFRAAPQLSPDHVVVYGDAHSFMMPNRTHTDEQLKGIGEWIAYFYDHSIEWAGAGSLIAASEPCQSEAFDQLPQAFVTRHYAPYIPPYKYTSILQNDVINSFNWQPVYGYITPEAFADAVIAQTTEKAGAR